MGRFNLSGDLTSLEKPQLEFIEKALEQNGFKGPDVVFEQVGLPGDNNSSNVKRIVINENGSKVKIFAKILPTNRIKLDIENVDLVSNNECFVYTKVLPKFREIQKNAGVPEDEWFKFAECYAAEMAEPIGTMLFEDLREYNYNMLDRFKPLNNDCVKMVLKHMAIFHSLSYVLKHQNPEVFDEYKANLPDLLPGLANSKMLKVFYEQVENNAIDIMEEDKYRNILKGTASRMPHHGLEANKGDIDSKYSVIQLGDVCINNVLFQMDGEQPKSCVLLDLQMAKVTNPMYDLMYMLFTSTSHKQRQDHFYEFIDHYHKEMEKSLQYYGLDIASVYPRKQLDADMKRYAKYLLGMTVIACTFTIRKSEDSAKFKETLENNTVESFNENPDKVVQDMLEKDEDTAILLKGNIEGLVDSFIEFGLV